MRYRLRIDTGLPRKHVWIIGVGYLLRPRVDMGYLLPRDHTANEGPVRIQYKCLVPIYVFPEMKLCNLLISKMQWR